MSAATARLSSISAGLPAHIRCAGQQYVDYWVLKCDMKAKEHGDHVAFDGKVDTVTCDVNLSDTTGQGIIQGHVELKATFTVHVEYGPNREPPFFDVEAVTQHVWKNLFANVKQGLKNKGLLTGVDTVKVTVDVVYAIQTVFGSVGRHSTFCQASRDNGWYRSEVLWSEDAATW